MSTYLVHKMVLWLNSANLEIAINFFHICTIDTFKIKLLNSSA